MRFNVIESSIKFDWPLQGRNATNRAAIFGNDKSKYARFPHVMKYNDAVFRGDQTSVQNDFLNHEFHIVLKHKNLEICKHSSFFLIVDEIVFFIKFEVPKFTN